MQTLNLNQLRCQVPFREATLPQMPKLWSITEIKFTHSFLCPRPVVGQFPFRFGAKKLLALLAFIFLLCRSLLVMPFWQIAQPTEDVHNNLTKTFF